MKLVTSDQIHVSSVKPDALRPGEAFEVSDDLGRELLAKHPNTVFAAADLVAKAMKAPLNKAEPRAPSNKGHRSGK